MASSTVLITVILFHGSFSRIFMFMSHCSLSAWGHHLWTKRVGRLFVLTLCYVWMQTFYWQLINMDSVWMPPVFGKIVCVGVCKCRASMCVFPMKHSIITFTEPTLVSLHCEDKYLVLWFPKVSPLLREMPILGHILISSIQVFFGCWTSGSFYDLQWIGF